MTERRSGTDRRQYPRYPLRERRHGTRAMYQAGCPCTPCRASEAAYRAELRRRHLEGRPILGALVSPGMLFRQLSSLQAEGFTKAELARRLGLRSGKLRLHPESVALRSRLRVQRLYRLVMFDECLPHDTSGSSLNT